MFCDKCGAKITSNQKFCPDCGESTASSANKSSNQNKKSDTQHRPKIFYLNLAILIILIVVFFSSTYNLFKAMGKGETSSNSDIVFAVFIPIILLIWLIARKIKQ